MMRWAVAALICGLYLGRAVAAERLKTDVITLQNGDRISGRILYAQFGYLQLNSAHSGTVAIEWPSIRSIQSQYAFRVERSGGLFYTGTIHTTADGAYLVVAVGVANTAIPMPEVIRLVPYEASFWRQLDGSVSVGFSFAKSTDVSQGSLGVNAYYSGADVEAALKASAIITRDQTGATTDQDDIISTVFWLQPNPTFWGLLGALQRDRSVGVDGRAVVGPVLGRRLFQAYYGQASGIVGVVYNQEVAAAEGRNGGSAEAVLGGEWRVFKFYYPKIKLDLSVLLYPSLTESPRLRGSFNTALTFKLTERFALQLSENATYDSRPPKPGASTTDYSIVTSISYEFGPVIP